MDSNGSCGPRIEGRQMDPNLSGEALALKSAIRATKIEIAVQLKKIRIPRVRINENWGSPCLTIFAPNVEFLAAPPEIVGEVPGRVRSSSRASSGSERGSGGF